MKYIALSLILLFPVLSFSQNNELTIEVSKGISINNESGAADNVFKIKYANMPYEVIHFKVLNRWGNELYTSKSNDAQWDGKIDGKFVPQGTYHYSIKLKTPNREKKEFTGYFNVW